MRHLCKVTVGLCVKNAEQTVEVALNSILEQDYPRELMELIVVDGYSKDRTLLIIKKKFSNINIRYKIFQENVGLGMARQIVVDNADGDYIVWVDCDIILSRYNVRRQVEFMERNPAVGIGVAKYLLLPTSNLISFLENIPFVIECLKYKVGEEVAIDITGTPGSIFRVKAIKQVGGFDAKIRGAGEDSNLAYKIKLAGWLVCLTPASFYPVCRGTWIDLWNEYFWWGYGAHYNFHKIKSIIKLYKMTPLAGFLAGTLRLPLAYKLTRRKSLLLLPFHYAFKRIAWFLGFLKSQIDGYGHEPRERLKSKTSFVSHELHHYSFLGRGNEVWQ